MPRPRIHPKKPPPQRVKSRSGFERKVQKYLRDKGVEFKYEAETLEYTIPQSKHRYTPDFLLPNGIVVEAKGIFDREARAKMLLVIKQHPERDIRMVLMRDQRIYKNAKTKYSDWLKKNGIKFHVSPEGHIPESWLQEPANFSGEAEEWLLEKEQ